jgi:type I restriction enzyme S subunit
MQTLKLTKKYETYPEYKDSGVEWLGKIPKGWKLNNLQHLFTKVKRMGFENEQLLSVYRDLGVIIKSSRDDNYNKASDDLSTYQLVECGDLAINKMKAWQGSIAVSEHRGIVSPAYFICKPLSKNNSRFIHYLLRSDIYIKQYERNSGGVRNDQWDLNYERFRKLEVGIPEISEQTKIAKYLDEKTSSVDQIIERKQKLIELLREKRTAVINHVVTKGLDPKVGLVESGVNWIGKIPKEWEVSSIKTLLKMKITDGPHTTPVLLENGIRFISAESIQANNTIDFNKNRGFISRNDHVEFCKKANPKRDDIFMVKSGATTGRVAIVETDSEFSIWSPLALIRTDVNKALPKYIYFFLQSGLFQDQVKFSWSFGTQQNIGMRVIENLMILYPSLGEQKGIVKYLESKMPNFEIAIQKVEKTIETLQEFKSSLISNVVTGKIKV